MNEVTCPHPAYGSRSSEGNADRRGLAIIRKDDTGKTYIVCFTCSMAVEIEPKIAEGLMSIQSTEDPKVLAEARSLTRGLLNAHGLTTEAPL